MRNPRLFPFRMKALLTFLCAFFAFVNVTSAAAVDSEELECDNVKLFTLRNYLPLGKRYKLNSLNCN